MNSWSQANRDSEIRSHGLDSISKGETFSTHQRVGYGVSPTRDARRESRRDGARPIELVDGEKLVAMFEKLELGLKPKTVFDVDEIFFEEFRNSSEKQPD